MARDPKPDKNGHEGLAEGPEGDKPMAFLDHVGELRTRLVRMAISIVVGFFACFTFAPEISYFLRRPLNTAWANAGREGLAQLQALAIHDPMMVDIRVAVTAGIFLTAPYLFLQLWLFIAPGLYAREKKFAIPFVAISMVMFVAGAAFAFEVVLPIVYEFMISWSDGRAEDIQPELHSYFKGTTRILVAFGLVFEFPLLVAFLAKAGAVTEKTLIRFWKIAVLIMFVAAGLLTPPEPVSQILMAGPMAILYFISIGVAWVINPAAKIEAALAKYEADAGADADEDADEDPDRDE